jgi:hypothetical protein
MSEESDESKSMLFDGDGGGEFQQGSEDLMPKGFGEDTFNEDAGLLFNDSVDGSDALGIGFEESDFISNEVLDDATSTLLEQSSIIQLNEDLESLHDAYKASRIEIKDMEKRMKSRSLLIDKIRSAYLRDVVTIKHCLNDVLTGKEKKMVMDEFVGRLPSLDLGEYLDLYKPPNTKMRMKKCNECGGHLDVIIKDSDHVKRLMAMIEQYQHREERLSITIATQDAESETKEKERVAALRQHHEEKNVLYGKMKRLNIEITEVKTENERMKKASGGYRDEIRDQKTEIERLLVKEIKLAEMEIVANELRTELRSATTEVSKNEDQTTELRKEIDDQSIQIKKLTDTLEKAQALARQLDADLKKSQKEEKKAKDLTEFLEKSLEEKSVSLVQMEGQMLEYKEQKEHLEQEGQMEMDNLNKVAEGLTEENGKLESELIENRTAQKALEKALKAAESLIAQKDSTIKAREREMMALAAEVEALQEELSALKQFVSDTVANRRTPSRKYRTGNSQEDEDESSDESETGNIWHVDDDSVSSSVVRSANEAAAMSPLMSSGIRASMAAEASATESEEPTAPAHGHVVSSEHPTAPAHDHVISDDHSTEGHIRSGSIGSLGEGSVSSMESASTPKRKDKKKKKKKKVEIEHDEDLDDEFNDNGSSSVGEKGGTAMEAKVKVNAPVTGDKGSTKIAPPTAQAKEKKKMRHERKVVEDTQVDLLPATDGAAAGELMMRDAMIKVLQTTLGSNNTRRAVNACRDMMAEYGKLLTDSMDAVWGASLLSKRGMDLLIKVQTVANSILSLKDVQKTDVEAHNKLGELVSDLVPIIGSEIGLKLTEKWQQDISLHKAISQLMIPTIDNSQVVVWSKYNKFFGDSQKDYTSGLREMKKAIKEMTVYFDLQNSTTNAATVNMVKDWADAKTIYFDVDNLVDKAKNDVKKEMLVEMEGIARELGLANGRFDAAKAFSKKMESKLETATRRLNDLEQLPAKVSSLEGEIGMLKKVKAEQASIIQAKNEEIEVATAADQEKEDQVAQKIKEMDDMKEALVTQAESKVKFEQSFIFETQKREKAETIIAVLKEKEEKRLNSMVDKTTDTALLMFDREIQTDFMTHPMSLRTKFAKPQKKGGKHRPYSVQLIDAPTYSQDVKFLSASAVKHGAQKIQGLSRGLGKNIMDLNAQSSNISVDVNGETTIMPSNYLNGGGSTISHEVSIGTTDDFGIGVTVRATTPSQDQQGRPTRSDMGTGTTAEFVNEISDRIMDQMNKTPGVHGSGLMAGPDPRGSGIDTPLSFVLSDDIMDDEDHGEQQHHHHDHPHAMRRTDSIALDDLSVASSGSHFSHISADTAAAFTLASHTSGGGGMGGTSNPKERSGQMMFSRSISSPISTNRSAHGRGNRGYGKGQNTVQRMMKSNNQIPPLQHNQHQRRGGSPKGDGRNNKGGGDSFYYDMYEQSAPPYVPGSNSLFAPKAPAVEAMYNPSAANQLADLKASFFGKGGKK